MYTCNIIHTKRQGDKSIIYIPDKVTKNVFCCFFSLYYFCFACLEQTWFLLLEINTFEIMITVFTFKVSYTNLLLLVDRSHAFFAKLLE